MTWLLWRQHRIQLALAVAVIIAFAIPTWITGTHLTTALQDCQASSNCGGFDLLRHYGAIRVIVNLTMAVPLLIGVFWGATLFGREYDAGTATLVWTQSVTRRRWIASKVLTLFALSIACSATISGLVTWWSNTANATLESRFDGAQFDIQNIAPVGFAVFGAALGLAAGALWRRILPAMATTVGAFIGVRLLIELAIRPHYMSPITQTLAMGAAKQSLPSGSLEIGDDLVLHGHVLSGPVAVDASCGARALTRERMDACMSSVGYRIRHTYQPASRYWTFQWIEFGIFVGLAAILIAVAVLAVRRRDA